MHKPFSDLKTRKTKSLNLYASLWLLAFTGTANEMALLFLSARYANIFPLKSALYLKSQKDSRISH